MGTTLDRRVHVEHCMGTAFSIDVRDPGDWTDAVGEVVAWLHRTDEVFSTYRADSDISRMRRGELRLTDADPDVAVVLGLCAEVGAETSGRFTGLRDGAVDPTGLVKGWAVERASEMLRELGAGNHAVNGGGDVQLSGTATPGADWTVGIVDPFDRTRLLMTVRGRDLAVATSGTYERGAHVIDPFTGRPATGTASATVIGPSLTRADAYATAAFVMGTDAIRWVDGLDGYAALVVDGEGRIAASRRWPR